MNRFTKHLWVAKRQRILQQLTSKPLPPDFRQFVDWLCQKNLVKSFGFGLSLKKKSRHTDSPGGGCFSEGRTQKKTTEGLRICPALTSTSEWTTQVSLHYYINTSPYILVLSELKERHCVPCLDSGEVERLTQFRDIVKASKVGTLEVRIKLLPCPQGTCYCNKMSSEGASCPMLFPNAHLFKLVQIGGS